MQTENRRSNVVSIDSGGHRERVLARRDALIEEHLDLVRAVAASVKRRLPDCFDLDDLIAEGNRGLVAAATRYRPSEHRDVPFSAYARMVIRGAILDSIRDKVQRRPYTEATRPGLEVCEEPQAQSAIETMIDAGRLRRRVVDAVKQLPARERAVLIEYYGASEPSLREVGARIGMGRRRTEQIHRVAIDRLRDLLRSA